MSSLSVSLKVNILSLEKMQLEVGIGTLVPSLIYWKCRGLVNNGWISIIWEVLWLEGVKLFMRTPPILMTLIEEDISGMEIIINTVKFALDDLRCVNRYWVWLMVYSLACITARNEIWIILEYFKSTTDPLKISLGWLVSRLGGQDNSQCK